MEGHVVGTATRLALLGDLDVATAGWLRGRLEPLEAGGAHIVLDLRGLSFLDSVGVTELLRAHVRATHNGHRLELLAGDGIVRQRLRLLCLDEHLPLLD